MKGYIKFSTQETDEGIAITCETNLKSVSFLDKVALVDSLMQALELDESDMVRLLITLPDIREGQQIIAIDKNFFDAFGKKGGEF